MALPAVLAALGRGAATVGKFAGKDGGLTNAGQAAMNVQSIANLSKSIVGLGVSAAGAMSPLNAFSMGVGAVSSAVAGGIGIMTEPLKAVVGSFGSMRDAVGSLGAATSEFVKLYSPADVIKFDRAFKDATASIGKAIMPIHQFATALMGSFRDVMYKLSGPVASALGRVLDPITEAMPRITEAMAPLIQMGGQVADLFAGFFEGFFAGGGLETVLEGMTSGLAVLQEAMAPVIKDLTEVAQVFGLFAADVAKATTDLLKGWGLIPDAPPPGAKVDGAGVGAAMQNAQLGGIDANMAAAWKNAFQMGGGEKKDPAVATLDTAKMIYATLTEWKKEAAEWVGRLITGFNEAIGKIPGAGAAGAALRGDAAGTARELGVPDGIVAAAEAVGRGADPRTWEIDPRKWKLPRL